MTYASKSLCFILIALVASTSRAMPLPDDKGPPEALIRAVRSAKTFRIFVEQSFGRATTVTLPFGQAIRAFLKSTSLHEADGDADITFLVKATGAAISAGYFGATHYLYTGAELSGSLRVTERTGEFYEVPFERRVDPPARVFSESGYASPSNAPFNYAFDAFLTKLSNTALKLFGVPLLLSALHDKNEKIRRSAVEAMGTSDPAILDALISMLGDQSFDVQKATTAALTRTSDPRAIDVLLRALKSSSMDVRTMAAQILPKRKDCCPVDPLLVAFSDRRGRDREQVDEFRAMVALALGATKHPLALRRLIPAISSKIERPRVRSSVAEALGEFQNKTAVETLIAVIRNAKDDADVRSSAVRSLGPMGDPSVVLLLIQTLNDPEYDVRGGAALSLGFFKEARVVEALISAIAKRNLTDPPNAAGSLSKLTGQKFPTTSAWQKWWQDNKNSFDQRNH